MEDKILTLDYDLCGKFTCSSTDGSVVEFSPATREARVRFPVSAHPNFFVIFSCVQLRASLN